MYFFKCSMYVELLSLCRLTNQNFRTSAKLLKNNNKQKLILFTVECTKLKRGNFLKSLEFTQNLQ